MANRKIGEIADADALGGCEYSGARLCIEWDDEFAFGKGHERAGIVHVPLVITKAG
jgi:hypothetical protein